ncbi:PREDICTED: uncharacterized protein LOC107348846 [Acropora digitifera]|uniref:uncharacterized protein LOC107348846 n=1 Tax=Acropora digitifera TaxID=70779 RepID=UPI00077AC730|nr:PREDICTED: uncharacterized protein LOC107348846 [Acropora digitifera]
MASSWAFGKEKEIEERPEGNEEEELGNRLAVGGENEIVEQPDGNDEEEFGNSWAFGEENENKEQPEGNDKEQFGKGLAVDEEIEVEEQAEGNNEEEFGKSWEENEINELQPEGKNEEEFRDSLTASEENEIDERAEVTEEEDLHDDSWNTGSSHDKSEVTEDQFNLPSSGLRWKGLALSHRSSRDVAIKRKKSKRNTGPDNEITLSLVTYVIGGTFLIFLTMAFFIYAWPIRAYYAQVNRRLKQDIEFGYGNGELTSIRVQPNQEPFYPYQMQTPVARMPSYTHSAPRGILDYLGGRPVKEVLADDQKRDWRNAERRHIIKEQTSQRRDSLIDSLSLQQWGFNSSAALVQSQLVCTLPVDWDSQPVKSCVLEMGR